MQFLVNTSLERMVGLWKFVLFFSLVDRSLGELRSSNLFFDSNTFLLVCFLQVLVRVIILIMFFTVVFLRQSEGGVSCYHCYFRGYTVLFCRLDCWLGRSRIEGIVGGFAPFLCGPLSSIVSVLFYRWKVVFNCLNTIT